ncbi:MAG: hypothetical protein Q7J32_08690 [Sphingomonadaceae bacterium]|nr:hypothetical protein [Sphingomonadaceae bacterium]
MTQQALLRRDAFVEGATPTAAPAMTAAFAPGLRRFEIHPRVYGIMLGAIATFFGAYVVAFSGGAGMPILLTICGLSFVAYFGLATLLDGVSGDRLPDQSFAAFLRHDIDTASGPMSGRAALWQVVTLPLLMAGFGLFVLGYKLFA